MCVQKFTKSALCSSFKQDYYENEWRTTPFGGMWPDRRRAKFDYWL